MGEDNGKFRPELAQQRAMLEQARDTMRQRGFALEIDAATLSVQTGADKTPVQQVDGSVRIVPVKDRLRDLERDAENAYRAARELQRQLDALPAEQPVEATED